jgi:hypothetical protein
MVVAAAIAFEHPKSLLSPAQAAPLSAGKTTLKGEYAFGVTGYTPSPQVVAGVKFFDGRSGSDVAASSAPPSRRNMLPSGPAR